MGWCSNSCPGPPKINFSQIPFTISSSGCPQSTIFVSPSPSGSHSLTISLFGGAFFHMRAQKLSHSCSVLEVPLSVNSPSIAGVGVYSWEENSLIVRGWFDTVSTPQRTPKPTENVATLCKTHRHSKKHHLTGIADWLWMCGQIIPSASSVRR